jgi:hypothetical protein
MLQVGVGIRVAIPHFFGFICEYNDGKEKLSTSDFVFTR